MSEDHDQLRELLGAYVLGGLSAEDRGRLDAHLRGCAECRTELASYAPLPGLLRTAEAAAPQVGAESPEQAPAEQALAQEAGLARVLDAARSARAHRQRRARVLGVAAGAVLVFLGAVGALLVSAAVAGPDGPPGTPLIGASAGAHGQTKLESKPWGTAVALDLTGLPAGERFIAWVLADDGTLDQAATWSSTPDGRAHVTGASAITRRDVARLRVTTAEGTLLLSTRV